MSVMQISLEMALIQIKAYFHLKKTARTLDA